MSDNGTTVETISPFSDVNGNDLLIQSDLDGDGTFETIRRDIRDGIIINGYNDGTPFYSYLATFGNNDDVITLTVDPIDEGEYGDVPGLDSFFSDPFIEDVEFVTLQLIDQGPTNDLRDADSGEIENFVSSRYDLAAPFSAASVFIQDATEADFFTDDGSLALPRVTIETIDPNAIDSASDAGILDSLFDIPLDEILDTITNENTADPDLAPFLTNLQGGDTAAFFLRIEGNTAETNPLLDTPDGTPNDYLDVNLSIGGTAGLGTDYIFIIPQLVLEDRLFIDGGTLTINNIPPGSLFSELS